MRSNRGWRLRESSLDEFERIHVKPNPGRTLIVGSQVYGGKEDRRLRYADSVGMDMLEGPGVDLVIDLEEPLRDGLGQFDHVECMSVLEHSRRPWLLAANVERLMKPGATLFFSIPFIWRFHGYPNDHWRMTPEALLHVFPNIEWRQRMFASDKLSDNPKVKAIKSSGHPYLSRTETVGFGIRK